MIKNPNSKPVKNILLIITLFTSLSLFSQVRKEVENGIWVTFPKNPQYSVAQGARQYIAQTDNAVCMVQSVDLIFKFRLILNCKSTN